MMTSTIRNVEDQRRPTGGLPSIERFARCVSATTLGVEAEVRGMVRPLLDSVERVVPEHGVPPRRPNYVLRRAVAAALAVVVTIGATSAVTAVLAGLGGAPASASEAQPAPLTAATGVHVARRGESLWTIAEIYRGRVSHARYVDALVRLNGGPSITAGQAVHLP